MTDDQFARLFRHMNKRFDHIEKRLDTKASQESLDSLMNIVDGLAKRFDTFEIEQGARSLQCDWHLAWPKKPLRKLEFRSKIFSSS